MTHKQINIHNTAKIGLVLITLFAFSNSLSFLTELQRQQKFCFYEAEAQQKYTYVTFSPHRAKHEVQVSHIEGRGWKSLFFRTTQQNQANIRVDKLASMGTTYSFCLKNLGQQRQSYRIEFNTGLQVMELHKLPDATDGQNLERQLNWMDQQLTSLHQRSQNIEGLRRINYTINGMVGTKMIVFAIIGLAAIAIVNFVFFRNLKYELKKRKLI